MLSSAGREANERVALETIGIALDGRDLHVGVDTYRSSRAVEGGAESGSRAVEQVGHTRQPNQKVM